MIPDQIRKSAAEADRMIKHLAREAELRPRPGRPAKQRPYKQGAFFVADSAEELDALLRMYCHSVGPRGRGNRRHGATAFYGALVQCFYKLHRARITLPRGGSLSRSALMWGLAAVLVQYGHLRADSVARLLLRGDERGKLGHKLARVFDRVADAVEQDTPQK